MNTFLDPYWADLKKQEAMAQVYAAAPEDWKKEAYVAVTIVAYVLPQLISDDIWRILWKPPEPRALGPILGAMARAGWLQKTGKQKRTDQVSRHATDVNIWKSLVYGHAPLEMQPVIAAWKQYFNP